MKRHLFHLALAAALCAGVHVAHAKDEPTPVAVDGSREVTTVLVELPAAGNIRMIGKLLGDRRQDVVIGSNVEVVFEHHTDNDPPYSLAHWKVV